MGVGRSPKRIASDIDPIAAPPYVATASAHSARVEMGRPLVQVGPFNGDGSIPPFRPAPRHRL
jgi:hypothetical protein